MVITGLTRNQVAFTGSRVRIPHSPPKKVWQINGLPDFFFFAIFAKCRIFFRFSARLRVRTLLELTESAAFVGSNRFDDCYRKQIATDFQNCLRLEER